MPLALALCGMGGVGCVPNPVASASAGTVMAIDEAKYVRIGGIDQWVTIKGADRRNPVVLFLHGGPGIASSPFAEASYAGWEEDFTLVQWDQRGAGRTFARNGTEIEPTMTVERMTEDGIELADYLRDYLGQEKIIITGGSWGSILGLRMAYSRPDLIHAYVGLSQSINFSAERAASYHRVREIAQSKNDTPSLATLDELGPPPWSSRDRTMQFRRLQQAYQLELTTAPSRPIAIAPEYQDDFKSGTFGAAGDFSQRHFFGPTQSGPIFAIDNASLTDFRVPIFLIHGEVDLTIPLERVQSYFDTIRAPRKAFYVVPGAGHDPSIAAEEMLRRVLLTEVQPIR